MSTTLTAAAIGKAWDTYLSELCTNIRQVDLLLNDFQTAQLIIGGEVNERELLELIAIQRFNPTLYRVILDNHQFVTYGQLWIKNPQAYLSDEAQKRIDDLARVDFMNAINKSGKPGAYLHILQSLFPVLKEKLPEAKREISYGYTYRDMLNGLRQEKRICHPDYFPIYFRYQVPESMIGSREFDLIIDQFENVPTEQGATLILKDLLLRNPRGSLRRYDLLDKLSNTELSEMASARLSVALARAASDYQYDMMDIGEASFALDVIFKSASRLRNIQSRNLLLIHSLSAAADDTFANRFLARFELAKESGEKVPDDIDLGQLKNAFRSRMFARYRLREQDYDSLLTTSDPQAFWRWADMGHNERRHIRKFWRSRVAQRQDNLMFAVRMFFSGYAWSESPRSRVESVFTDSYLKHGFRTFTPIAKPSVEDLLALNWLGRYLLGEFEHGVPFNWAQEIRRQSQIPT